MVLQKLKADAEAWGAVHKAVITVPAYFRTASGRRKDAERLPV